LQNRYVRLLQLRHYELIGQIGIVRFENIPVLLSGTFYNLYILFRWFKALLCETMTPVYTLDIRQMNTKHRLSDPDK